MSDLKSMLKAVGVTAGQASNWLPYLTETCERFQILGQLRQAAFLAQLSHESGRFTILEENLRYSASGLRVIFPKYFPTDEAAQAFAKRPEAIANRVYSNRMGNGDEASGDGWRYRGRGLIQLTGRHNYRAAGAGLGSAFEAEPDLVSQMHWAALTAGWFWDQKELNQLADIGDMATISKRINGGTIGLENRLKLYKQALEA